MRLLKPEERAFPEVLAGGGFDVVIGNPPYVHWLRVEFGVEKPGQRLTDYQNLSTDDFTAEVRKRRPKGSPRLSPKGLAELAAVHRQYGEPERARTARLWTLEQSLATLVNQAYGLSADDIELLWRTAPPRMPGS